MPFSIFEYQDMMHPMGLSPVAPKKPCPVVKPGKCRDNERLRTTYGPAPCRTPNYSCVGPIMDLLYCTGGEGVYDGTPTFWMSNARAGCKTNKEGKSMPYGRAISKEEYDRRGRTLCADGTYDENLNPWSPKCQGHGGLPGTKPTTGGTGPIVDIVPQLVDGIGCPTNLRKDTAGNFIVYSLAKNIGSSIGKSALPTFCNKDTRQYVPNTLPEWQFEGALMQTALSGKDADGYVWSGQTNQLLRKKCPATFKKLYDIANAEYQRTVVSSSCMTTLPIGIRPR